MIWARQRETCTQHHDCQLHSSIVPVSVQKRRQHFYFDDTSAQAVVSQEEGDLEHEGDDFLTVQNAVTVGVALSKELLCMVQCRVLRQVQCQCLGSQDCTCRAS